MGGCKRISAWIAVVINDERIVIDPFIIENNSRKVELMLYVVIK